MLKVFQSVGKNFHERFFLYACFFMAIVLPFGKAPVSIAAALFLINWILEGGFKEKWNLLKKNPYAWLFSSVYLIHVLAMIYTTNVAFGLFDLQIKLSLLIMPLVFFSSKMKLIDENRQKIFLLFVISCFFAALICLVKSAWNYTSSIYIFYYESFSFFMHPAYFSMYLNLALLMILFDLESIWTGHVFAKIFLLFCCVFFPFAIILLSSKIGFLMMGIIFVFFASYMVFVKRKFYIGIVSIVLFLSSLLYLIFFSQAAFDRFKLSSYALFNDSKLDPKEGTTVRMHIWKAGLELVSDSPWIGYGTGDIKDVLMNKYLDKGILEAYKYKLNAHNQFIQICIATGLLGFIILLLSFFYPMLVSFRLKNYLYALFLLTIILNLLVESMLETQAGVIFYAFFNSLFAGLLTFKKKNPTTELDI